MPEALNEAKRKRMIEIVKDLKERMRELDQLGQKIRLEGKTFSPSRTRKILEEIKVPSLKLIKES